MAICLTLMALWLPAVNAQSTPDQVVWEEPVLLHQTTGDILQPSSLVVDPWGTVHVMWSERPEVAQGERAPYALWYTRLQDGAWSPPLDVILSPAETDALRPNVAVDSQAQLHAVWNAIRYPYFYSAAPADVATSAQGWRVPEAVDGTGVIDAAVAVDAAKRVHVTYVTWGEGVYFHTRNPDNGQWSEPVLVAEPTASNRTPESVRMVVDEAGVVHIFWTEVAYPEGAPLQGAYHTRSTDGGSTWAPPLEVAGPGYRAESIAVDGNSLHLLLLGSASEAQRLHKRSTNGGRSWSGARVIIPKAQGSGLSSGSIAIDSAGTLHAVAGMRIDQALGYATGDGETWSPPIGIPGLQGDSLEDIHMAVGSGNKLHVMFVDAHQKLWYVQGTIPAPAVAPPPRPTEELPAAPTPTLTAAPATVAPSPMPPAASTTTAGTAESMSSLTIILLAIGPVMLLILGILLLKLRRSGR